MEVACCPLHFSTQELTTVDLYSFAAIQWSEMKDNFLDNIPKFGEARLATDLGDSLKIVIFSH